MAVKPKGQQVARKPRARRAANPLREPQLYWQELLQLKASAICMRLYRNRLGWRVRWVEIVKAVASSGGVAGWVVWRDIPFVWTGIIAAAQLLDALKAVFPFARLHKAASDLTVALELLSIDAEAEWEGIHRGDQDGAAIIRARTRLQKLKLTEERRHFPEGLELPGDLVALATHDAQAYFRVTYSGEASP